jgi:hypothetical protein
VRIKPVTLEANRLWSMALDLASDLGGDREWSLIGGLMVQLHGFEHEDDLRPTADIDILGAARKSPTMSEQIASILVEKGAEVAMPLDLIRRLGIASASMVRWWRFSARTGCAPTRRRSVG